MFSLAFGGGFQFFVTGVTERVLSFKKKNNSNNNKRTKNAVIQSEASVSVSDGPLEN